MKKYIWFFAFLCMSLFLAFQLKAQADYINRNVSDFINNVEFHNSVNKLPPDLEGSPYLNDDFTHGSIYLEGKYKFTDVPLRYNIYNDLMEFEDKGHILDLDEKHKIDSVIINNKTFVYTLDKGNREGGYYELLAQGKVSLLGKLKIEFRPREPAKPMRDPVPPKFVRLPDEYFVQLPGGELEKVKNVKKLIQALPDHQKALNTFVENKKVKNHEAEGMAIVVNYFNTL